MSAISNFLTFLRSAIYAIDVRDGIADAIEQCYNDVNNPTLKTEALEAALQTKIDEGEMAALTIGDHTITTAKLAQGVIDNTLETSGAAADAAETGRQFGLIKADLDAHGFTDAQKNALLACFQNIGWKDTDTGQTLYDDLRDALFDGENIESISAVYTPGSAVIYTDDALDVLREYLTVTATYSDSQTRQVSGYTLSGTLAVGINTIVVSYNGKATTITVTAVDFYDIWEWDSTFTGAGKLTRINAAAIDGGSSLQNKGIYLRDREIEGNTKRGFVAFKGKAPIVLESDKTQVTSYYPIPVPKTATKATCAVTPNTQRLAVYLYRFDPTDQTLAPYTRFNTIAWNVGEQVVTFTAEENLFISFNCSVDSSFTPYSVEPDMNILFE